MSKYEFTMGGISVIKRSGEKERFNIIKVYNAVLEASKRVKQIDKNDIDNIVSGVAERILKETEVEKEISVESIQNIVQEVLMDLGYHKLAEEYIIYRFRRSEVRKCYDKLQEDFPTYTINVIITALESDSSQAKGYDVKKLVDKFETFKKPNMTDNEKVTMLIKGVSELVTKDEPHWEYVAGNIMASEILNEMISNLGYIEDYYEFMVDKGLYHKSMVEDYSVKERQELLEYIDRDRDNLMTYSGIKLLYDRYLVRDYNGELLETPQLMFMGISMFLMRSEDKKDRLDYVKRYYDGLSNLKFTVATPTMSNARTPFHQLSSCFIETVEDSLDGIYRANTNFAQVSKYGGGMGTYWGHVRANGGSIRGFKGASSGVISWIRLINDTAVAVDQLGVRQGAVSVTLDAWHKDLPEFLQLRTNNGDDRMKAHDVFPAVSYPDLFWKLAENDIRADWHLFDPHEVETVMGYRLEDYYGKEWEKRYFECVDNPEISRRTMKVLDIVRLVITSLVETGTPFTVNRDTANEMNPNKHEGMIYSSNLCQEIFMNQSSSERIYQVVDRGNVVTEEIEAGDFPVCNLASLVLGNINLEDDEEMEELIDIVVRGLDNVITHNLYPTPYAEISNMKYRSIGLGTSGYHHALAKRGIYYSSDEHLEFMDNVYERINYYAIKSSNSLAKEKGHYPVFPGSEWSTGEYFERRNYNSDKWLELKESVAKHGVRNGWIMAVAPTGSTSIIAGTSAGVDPIMSRYFLEEKKGAIVPRVAPELTDRSFWTYENAHEIDQLWTIKASGVRQRHIDQGQSVNIYITPEMKMSEILKILVEANKVGMKSIYYFRSKSLDIDDCDTCSA